MEARSRDILEQLNAEARWRADGLGRPGAPYPVRPPGPWSKKKAEAYWANPEMNINRWRALARELCALEPNNDEFSKLRNLYGTGWTGTWNNRGCIQMRADILQRLLGA